MPEISIIIPFFNSEKTITRTIVSLSLQTYKNFEIIFIDDKSIDSTRKIIEKLIVEFDLKATLVVNNSNLGPSHSRLNGIKIAKGKYISFCDSDDWYDPNYLSLMYEKIIKDNDIVVCNYKLVYKNGRIINRQIVKNSLVNISTNVDSLSCLLVEKSLFQFIEFPNIRNGEDMAIIPVLFLKAKSIGVVCDCIYNYYQLEQSLSKSTICTDNLKKSLEYIEKNVDKDLFKTEIEFLGIRNFLYGASLIALKSCCGKSNVLNIIDWFNGKYPNWEHNKYLKTLPIYKKIFLYTIKYKSYPLMKLLSIIHKLLTK